MLVAFIFKRSTRTHPDLFKFEHSLSQIFHLTRYVLLLCKGAAIAAALVDQLMADVDSLSMSSIVPGSLRKSLYTIFPTYFEWPSVCFTDCSFLPGLFHKLKSFIFNSFFFVYILTVSAATVDSGDVRKLDELTCQSLASDSGWKYVLEFSFYFNSQKFVYSKTFSLSFSALIFYDQNK